MPAWRSVVVALAEQSLETQVDKRRRERPRQKQRRKFAQTHIDMPRRMQPHARPPSSGKSKRSWCPCPGRPGRRRMEVAGH